MSVAMRGLLLHSEAQGLWEVGLIKASDKWEEGRGGEAPIYPNLFLSYYVHQSGLVIPKTVSMVGEAAFQFFKN